MQKTERYSIDDTKTGKWINLWHNDIVIDDEIINLIKIHKQLSVPCNYLYPLDNLPIEIETLYIEEDRQYEAFATFSENNFNKPLENLPPKLKKLWICSFQFNQSLDYLPESLKELIISSIDFDKELNNLPPGLKTLTIEWNKYNKPLYNLPQGLDELNISQKYYPEYLEYIKNKYPKLKIGKIHKEW